MDLRQQQYAEFHLWREPGLLEHPPAEGGRWRNVYRYRHQGSSQGLHPGSDRSGLSFPDGSDPIGKVVRFNSIPFRVVGVLQKKGYNSMGMDQDDLVLAPYTTVMKRILAQTYLGGIVCSAITEEASQPARDQISEILRRNHKLKDATETTEADEDDFNIRSQEEISSMMNSTMSTITILLGSVAGISLLVGGIGIMNIMYVSVTERTREIGLRMSVGARGIDILNQFLIEAILLSVTGGIIGVILGVSLSLSLNAFLHIATQIEPWSIIMSFAVCTFTGVFFGWYPAKKAARLDPIEAIGTSKNLISFF